MRDEIKLQVYTKSARVYDIVSDRDVATKVMEEFASGNIGVIRMTAQKNDAAIRLSEVEVIFMVEL